MTFSEKLTILRKKKGLSQEQLAEMLGVSRQSVSKWEAQQALPETAKIVMISDIFQVPIDLLLKDSQTIETEDIISGAMKQNQRIAEGTNTLFCSKCGQVQPVDSAFCGNCGNPLAKNAQPVVQEPKNEYPQNENQRKVSKDAIKERSKVRSGMKIGMIICFVFVGVYCMMAVMKMQFLAAATFFGVLGVMFLGLGLSTKENKYVFGKKKGLKKGAFVVLCILSAFTVFGVITFIINPSSIIGRRAETSQIQSDALTNRLNSLASERKELEKKKSKIESNVTFTFNKDLISLYNKDLGNIEGINPIWNILSREGKKEVS